MRTQEERKAMFGATPESFRRRVAEALPDARRVEPARKRVTLRTVLIAALVLALLTAAAYAVGTRGGLIDYLSEQYRIAVPDTARELLETTSPRAFSLAGARFSLNETVADGRILYLTTSVTAAAGERAVFYWSFNDTPDMPMQPSALAAYGGAEGDTYQDAARRLGVPLYGVSVRPDLKRDGFTGDEMLDAMWLADGALLLIDMLALETDEAEVPVFFSMEAQRVDAETGAAIGAAERLEVPVRVPVTGVLGTRGFDGEAGDSSDVGDSLDAGGSAGAAVLGGAGASLPPLPYRVVGAVAETTPLGTYVTVRFRANDGVAKPEFGWAFFVRLLDDAGEELPAGMSLSSRWDGSAWPEVAVTLMTGVNGAMGALNVEMSQQTDDAVKYADRLVRIEAAEQGGA